MILALSGSTDYFSLAVLSPEYQLLGEFGIFTHKLQKWGILAVENLLKTVEIELRELKIIAVDSGPGKFTGLRIAVALAKTLAFTLNLPMNEYSSLDLLYSQVVSQKQKTLVALDGKQGRVFAKMYDPDGDDSPIYDVEPDFLLGRLREAHFIPYYTLGDGFQAYPALRDLVTPQSRGFFAYPKASFVYPGLPSLSYESVNPRYYRKTQAEEAKDANFGH